MAACAVIALVLRDYLASRSATSAVLPDVLPVLPEDLGAQSQGWQWTQSTGDSTRIEARADGLVQGADGRRTDLRNATLKIFHEDSGSRDHVESAAMRLMDAGDLFSEGETVMTLGIAESGSSPPAVITTSGVTFLTSENRARTDQAVRYDFEGWVGTSLGAVFDAGLGELRMLADVRLESRDVSGPNGPTEIRAGSLHYSEQGARIDLSDGATVRQGTRSIECAEATLWLVEGRIERIDGIRVRGTEAASGRASVFVTPTLRADFGSKGELLRIRGRGPTQFVSDETGQRVVVRGQSVDMRYDSGLVPGQSFLRTIEASDSASATLETTGDRTSSTLRSDRLRLTLWSGSAGIKSVEALQRGVLERTQADADTPLRTLEGDRVRIRYREHSAIESLVATGDARLLQYAPPPGRSSLRTVSDSLEAAFDPGTFEIAGILQSGAFRFEEEPDHGGVPRSGAAERARFDLEGSLISLEGSATVSDGGSVITAQRVVVDRETGRLEARGGATASMASVGPVRSEPRPNGLFGGPQPVYASADSLVSLPETSTVEFRGSARVWQRENRIDADVIAFDRGSSGLRAVGAVLVSWMEDPSSEGGQPGPVTVRAKEMHYEGAAGEAVFRVGVDFRRAGMRVLSDELRTNPGSGGDEASGRAVATGAVRIAQSLDGAGVRGFGDRAELRLAESEIVVTGAPARIVGPDGTETQGGSLTFRASGDSLQVFGRGAERAYTYHPASR